MYEELRDCKEIQMQIEDKAYVIYVENFPVEFSITAFHIFSNVRDRKNDAF